MMEGKYIVIFHVGYINNGIHCGGGGQGWRSREVNVINDKVFFLRFI